MIATVNSACIPLMRVTLLESALVPSKLNVVSVIVSFLMMIGVDEYTDEKFSSRLFSIRSKTLAEIAWLHMKCVSETIKSTNSVLFCQESA